MSSRGKPIKSQALGMTSGGSVYLCIGYQGWGAIENHERHAEMLTAVETGETRQRLWASENQSRKCVCVS
jgi:hypothetical protein